MGAMPLPVARTPLSELDPPIALGALDGRYRGAVAPLVDHLSEAALNRARLHVEVDPVEREYVAALEALREPGDRDGGGSLAHATCSGARRTSSRSAIATTAKKMIPSPAAMMFVAQRL